MIGFFDSGVGGLTIEQAARKAMPEYDFLYLGDSAHAPYGNKSKEEITERTLAGVNWLITRGCKLVILACNSASAQALREIQQTYFPPTRTERVLGIIRPTAEFFAESEHHNLVVFSTPTTAKTGAYQVEIRNQNPGIEVMVHGCENWAPMIEQGLAQTSEMKEEVLKEVARAKEGNDFDAALLACTHYPYVQSFVEETMGPKTKIYNQADIIVTSLKRYLARHSGLESRLETNRSSQYYVTGDVDQAEKNALEQFGYKIRFKKAAEHK